MVGGSLRVLGLLPPLKLVAMTSYAIFYDMIRKGGLSIQVIAE
jgi:hypothetical protein